MIGGSLPASERKTSTQVFNFKISFCSCFIDPLWLIYRWVRSGRLPLGGESTTYFLWFWPQWPATCCAGCLIVSWPWWQHSALPTSLLLWPAWCPHYWPRAALSSTLSSTYSWTDRWVSNGTVGHVRQLYLHSKKRQITTAEIIQMVYLNINSSVREFTDKSKSRRTS